MIAVTEWAAELVAREYSIQILLQKQSPDSLAHFNKASTSADNVLGVSGAYSHKLYQKLSLHKIAHLNNGHILQMVTSFYKLHYNLLALPPQFPTLQPGPEVIKLFLCSTQVSMKFFLIINVKCQQLLAF